MSRRRDRRFLFALPGIFVAAATFAFLNQGTKTEVEATSLDKFDPGYIISDYAMGNYKSMSEKQIQEFLTSKNGCTNKDKALYDTLAATWGDSGYTWHFEKDHFVCLSEEKFGDGEVIGEGETAAHIIWQAAQDYQINPQVLLVLLQKETSLITDPYPNNRDYRKATGYGCPDTAACSEKYYGFKNQIRNAASLFHSVLSGGWTNYPLGKNYIQYNPNKDCGGSEVDIRSLATSALYRYTPYQPNEGAIKAGYGTASCGAYGNRNFYLYYEDWFGGIRDEGYTKMGTARYMTNKKTKKTAYYTMKKETSDGSYCLSEDGDESKECVPYADLTEFSHNEKAMEKPRFLTTKKDATKVTIGGKYESSKLTETGTAYYDKEITLPNGKACMIQAEEKDKKWCVPYDNLEEVKLAEKDMLFPRILVTKKDAKYIEPVTMKTVKEVEVGTEILFNKVIDIPKYGYCLKGDDVGGCILMKNLDEGWNEMQYERDMKTVKDTYKIDAYTGKQNRSIFMNNGMKRKYVSKILYNGEWCLRTEYDETNENDQCVMIDELTDDWNTLEEKVAKTIKSGSTKIDAYTLEKGLKMDQDDKRTFVAKFFIASKQEWCYRTEYDENLKTNNCFLESNLK